MTESAQTKKKLIDFKCRQANLSGFPPELIDRLSLTFPKTYLESEWMVKAAQGVQAATGNAVAILPFCHTLEAEALGGLIALEDGVFGPRAKGYAYETLDELLQMPAMDFTSGRLQATLEACRLLKEAGTPVAIEISGFFSILSNLIDLTKVFKAWRKRGDDMKMLQNKLAQDLAKFFPAAKEVGVDILCYADPAGGVDIVGPKYTEVAAKEFLYPLIKEVSALADEHTIIHLCPKASLILHGLGLAKRKELDFAPGIRYVDACLQARGNAAVIGQACVKNAGCILRHGKLWVYELQ